MLFSKQLCTSKHISCHSCNRKFNSYIPSVSLLCPILSTQPSFYNSGEWDHRVEVPSNTPVSDNHSAKRPAAAYDVTLETIHSLSLTICPSSSLTAKHFFEQRGNEGASPIPETSPVLFVPKRQVFYSKFFSEL